MDQITKIAVAYATIVAATGCALVEYQYTGAVFEALRDMGHRPSFGRAVFEEEKDCIANYIYLDK